MNIISFPIMSMFALYIILLVLSVFFLHVGQLAGDKAEGVVHSDSPARALLTQRDRAFRTATWSFGLSFLVAMTIAGTVDFPM